VVRKRSEQGNLWGVVRLFTAGGLLPVDDACGFDGWYADRQMAERVFNDWCERYPHLQVGLVQSDRIRYTARIPAQADEQAARVLR
jgi:hypothetical protein